MKKIFTLLAICLTLSLTVDLSAQSQRMVFVEEATQASCPPCASQNPPLQALINANSDKVVFVGYQVWWPGFDPMYEDNPTEVQWRIGEYYTDITGAPNVKVQGVSAADVPSSGFTQNDINTINAEMSEFDLNLDATINNGMLEISGDATATMEASGDLRLRLIIIEHIITAEDAPGGTNGETEYHNVFKKFVNGPEGIDLADAWAVGDSYEINETFDLSTLNIYNYSEVQVVAIIQNDDTKFVHQAAIADDVEIVTAYTNNSGIKEVLETPKVCLGEQTVSPIVSIQNTGNADLTSVDIIYSINGGAEQTYAWTGNISTLGSEEVTLDSYTFEAMADNELTVTLANPNGEADEDSSDDAVTTALPTGAVTNYETIDIEIQTDNYGYELYWEITDEAGTVVASGGNENVGPNGGGNQTAAAGNPGAYPVNSFITEQVVLPASGCYGVRVVDDWGDGICCAYGNGYFRMKDADGNTLVDQGAFGATADDVVNADLVTSVNELTEVSNLTIFPNPTDANATMNFTLAESMFLNVDVINTLGQRVQRVSAQQFAAGQHTIELNTSELPNGLYYINVSSADKQLTYKVAVSR